MDVSLSWSQPVQFKVNIIIIDLSEWCPCAKWGLMVGTDFLLLVLMDEPGAPGMKRWSDFQRQALCCRWPISMKINMARYDNHCACISRDQEYVSFILLTMKLTSVCISEGMCYALMVERKVIIYWRASFSYSTLLSVKGLFCWWSCDAILLQRNHQKRTPIPSQNAAWLWTFDYTTSCIVAKEKFCIYL